MYIDKTSIEVIGDKWIEGKEKPEKLFIDSFL